MSKDYTQKIRNLLTQSNQTVPYIFERFYTVLKKITLELNQQNSQPKLFQQYSLIFRTVKKYIKDQPYLLINNSEKIQKELKSILHPLLIQLRQDVLSKKFLEYFSDKDMNQKITSFIFQAEKIKQQYSTKNVKIKAFGTHEMSNAFWIKKFKTQYAVHFDSFWNSFLQFIEQVPYFEYFISTSSKKSIMKKVDPQRKFFITSSNVSQLFYQLSQPLFLQRLADQTAKGQKSSNFTSKDFLQMQFHQNVQSTFETDLKQGQLFQISGEDTLIQGHRSISKHPPTIIFGSSVQSDIKIKNKYISRKQFMIIQQDAFINNTQNEQHVLPFSLVCLSSSNFTMVSYQRQTRLKAGTIFKVGQNAIQVVKISNCLKQVQKNSSQQDKNSQNSQQDETLQYLPVKSTHEISDEVELDYIFISGQQKGSKGRLTKDNLKIQHLASQSKQLKIQYKQNQFYLPSNTNIYVKTANQVINGELSSKIPVEENMKIILEECWFQIK